MAETKKVASKKKKKREGRAVFGLVDAVDDEGNVISLVDGKLTAVPSNWDGKKFKPLGKSMFASIDIYMDFRAYILHGKASRMTTLAEILTSRAARIRKFGDEGTRKKAEKLERMRAQIQTLEAEMAAEGINLDEI